MKEKNDTPSPPTKVVSKVTEKVTKQIKKRPWLKWVGLTLIIVITLILIISTIIIRSAKTPTTLPIDQSNTSTVSGTIVDEQGEPIDGAIIASSEYSVAVDPEGIFTIPLNPNDSITISAYGYVSTTLPAINASAITKLITALPGTVRVQIASPDNQPLPNTLLLQLNANTSEVTAQAITGPNGTSTFTNVPSGQITFIAMHPDYQVGWVQTNLEADSATQALLRLIPEEVDRPQKLSHSNSPRFVHVALAQNQELNNLLNDFPPYNPSEDIPAEAPPASQPSYPLNKYQFSRVFESQNDNFIITQNTHTLINVTKNNEDLAAYIAAANKLPSTQNGYIDFGEEARSQFLDLIGRKSDGTQVSTYRMISTNLNVLHSINTTWDTSGEVPIKQYEINEVSTTQWEINIPEPGANSTSTFITHQPAFSVSNRISIREPVNIITQGQVPWIETTGSTSEGKTYTYLRPTSSVCCRRPDTTNVSTLPTKLDSFTAAQSAIEARTTDGKTAVQEPTLPAPEPNVIDTTRIKSENPSLTFAKDNGDSFSFLAILAPHPYEAPFDFQYDFLQSRLPTDTNELNLFIEHQDQYQQIWKDYLYQIVTEASDSPNDSPQDMYDWLNNAIDIQRQEINQDNLMQQTINEDRQLLQERNSKSSNTMIPFSDNTDATNTVPDYGAGPLWGQGLDYSGNQQDTLSQSGVSMSDQAYISQEYADFIVMMDGFGGDAAAIRQVAIDNLRSTYERSPSSYPEYNNVEDFLSPRIRDLDEKIANANTNSTTNTNNEPGSPDNSELKARVDDIGTHVYDSPNTYQGPSDVTTESR